LKDRILSDDSELNEGIIKSLTSMIKDNDSKIGGSRDEIAIKKKEFVKDGKRVQIIGIVEGGGSSDDKKVIMSEEIVRKYLEKRACDRDSFCKLTSQAIELARDSDDDEEDDNSSDSGSDYCQKLHFEELKRMRHLSDKDIEKEKKIQEILAYHHLSKNSSILNKLEKATSGLKQMT